MFWKTVFNWIYAVWNRNRSYRVRACVCMTIYIFILYYFHWARFWWRIFYYTPIIISIYFDFIPTWFTFVRMCVWIDTIIVIFTLPLHFEWFFLFAIEYTAHTHTHITHVLQWTRSVIYRHCHHYNVYLFCHWIFSPFNFNQAIFYSHTLWLSSSFNVCLFIIMLYDGFISIVIVMDIWQM